MGDALREARRIYNGLWRQSAAALKSGGWHLTVMRFTNPKADWRRLLDFLRLHRDTDFGEMRFRSLQLVWSDWCASNSVARTLDEFTLKT